jgi:predicted RND superfamily exporter protein
MDFTSGNEARQMIEGILARGRKLFGPQAELRAVGYWPLYFKLVGYALDVQIQSFGLAFLLVFLVVFILFRDIRLTLVAIPANLFPVCFAGAILALGGIELDFATATIAAILLGIAVDDTIHLVYRYRKEHAGGQPRAEAMYRAIVDSGHALASTTLILCAGFAVLLFSNIKTLFIFGGLLTACLGAALLADLLFLPAMICWSHGAKRQSRE